MKLTLLTAIIPLLLNGQTEAGLTQKATQFPAANELEKAEPLFNQALELAAGSDGVAQMKAHANLFHLYAAYGKRDGGTWLRLGIPHLRTALQLANTLHAGMALPLSAEYALAIIQTAEDKVKPDASQMFETFLTKWLTEVETSSAPLTPGAATGYQALANFPTGSPGLAQALHACNLLLEMGSNLSAEFVPLMADCADGQLRAQAPAEATRVAKAALGLAKSDRRWSYESVLCQVILAEAAAVQEPSIALQWIDQASQAAAASLGPEHPIFQRILKARAAEGDPQAKRELKPRKSARDHLHGRIQAPKALKTAEPIYTEAARSKRVEGTLVAIVLVETDGTGRLLALLGHLGSGLEASATQCLTKWRFEPYQLDGKAVPGIATIEITFRLG